MAKHGVKEPPIEIEQVPVGGDTFTIGGDEYALTPELLAVKDRYDHMTPFQRKWLDHYLINRNGALACKLAGYAGGDETWRRMGTANKQKMDSMIKTLDKYAKDLMVAVTELTGIYSFWGITLVDTSQSMRDRLKASELLARALGAFDGENPNINININTDKFDKVPEDVLEAFIISNSSDTYATK